MRLVAFTRTLAEPRLGALVGDRVVSLRRAYLTALTRQGLKNAEQRVGEILPMDAVRFLVAGAGARAAAEEAIAIAQTVKADAAGTPLSFPLSEIRLHAPIRRPGKILCVGRNYADHVAEGNLAPSEWPYVFSKVPSCVIGPGEHIVHPTTTKQLDYEGELAFVIGRRAKSVSEEKALGYVAGYTIFNDVSARDIQFTDHQITLGKNFDTAAPLGPWLTLADEVPDPEQLGLRTYVNGELRQDSNTRYLIHKIPRLVSFLSRAITLEPGDVIATGTPAGVGAFLTPPRFLVPGDHIRIEIDRLGALENQVVAPSQAPTSSRAHRVA